ncbi:hypothetical protein ESZ36_18395 [Colwellia demingiae]|uniref:SnoaL-like domain-containing protein n=1 Tax=Colwellia demingiae TaxID=89401 RepID=A0A5C6Q8B2_9GAMM|nr:nuclear transport factor 2 family protein [Colwellia demingiae]TWX65245.1 hypothetical protein ESZ36_18395 [Colwellia demingiae]
MKPTTSYIAAAAFAATTILSACNSTVTEPNNPKVNSPMKAIAVKAQDAFFKDHDANEIKKYFREDYIQHNPHVPTGIEAVLGFLPVLEKAGTTYQTHRLLEDDEFIVMHNTYSNAESFGAKDVVTFDIWRMENGQVAEHWDAISPVIVATASGRSQFDGPTLVTDIDKTKENKQLIADFMRDVLFGQAPEKISEYISTEQYDQHNPMVKDGLKGLNEATTYLISQNNMFDYHKVHRILGEGNFVLVQSEGRWNDKAQAFYDMFRVEEGKIVEHWDIIQEVPEKMAHDNGMF